MIFAKEMGPFKVEKVIDFQTIQVDGWQVTGATGTKVLIRGMEFIKDQRYKHAFYKDRLEVLLRNKKIDLRMGELITNKEIECDVYLNGVNIITYFVPL